MSSLINADLYVDQGEELFATLELTEDDESPVNVANCVFVGTLKKSEIQITPSANITITVANSVLGMINIALDANTTQNLTGRYLYDVQMTDSQNVSTLILDGLVIVSEPTEEEE